MVVAQVVIFKSSYVSLCHNFIQQSILYYYDDFLYDSILNPDDTKLLSHITDCKTECYAKNIFGIFFYVSIYALFCSSPALLFPLIRTPIVTIQWYYEKNLGL